MKLAPRDTNASSYFTTIDTYRGTLYPSPRGRISAMSQPTTGPCLLQLLRRRHQLEHNERSTVQSMALTRSTSMRSTVPHLPHTIAKRMCHPLLPPYCTMVLRRHVQHLSEAYLRTLRLCKYGKYVRSVNTAAIDGPAGIFGTVVRYGVACIHGSRLRPSDSRILQ
jgi:hypothetical protein